jgi:microcystin degradation protein MlrC
MMTILPTTKEPMRSFVDKIKNLEKNNVALSISIIHGFMAGDSPDLGAKIITITDNNKKNGDKLSYQLGIELFSYRKNLAPKTVSANSALIKAKKLSQKNKKPILIADIWDNPGGGVAGDSTILINKAISMNLKNIAIGSIWDPVAVNICCAAGENTKIDLRFGGKVSSLAGSPVNKKVLVKKIVRNAFQRFGKSFVPMGDSVCITFEGIDVILNSNRCQTFSTDLFSELGVNIFNKKILIIKSTNHFYNSFFSHVSNIIYASIDGIYPNNPKKNKYYKLKRSIWPIVENPHGKLN